MPDQQLGLSAQFERIVARPWEELSSKPVEFVKEKRFQDELERVGSDGRWYSGGTHSTQDSRCGRGQPLIIYS